MSDLQIFGLERLEDRTLLAVSVVQNGAKLTITGDDYDNAVLLYDDAGGIHVHVDYDIDGTPEIDATYFGVESIKIVLKGGDDEVGVAGISIEQGITIDTGTGDDLVVFTNYFDYNEIDGSVSMTTGDGDDDVLFAGSYVTGNLTINTGNGEDYVGIGDYAGDDEDVYSDYLEDYVHAHGYTEIRGNTVINTGANDDDVQIQPFGAEGFAGEVEFRGHLTINTAAGDDDVDFGGNYDSDLHVHKNFSLQLGAGDDELDIDNNDYSTRFYGKVIINGGAGYDEIDDIDDWFDDPDATFAGGIGAIKFVKIEEINS
jgi:hypothetical protein